MKVPKAYITITGHVLAVEPTIEQILEDFDEDGYSLETFLEDCGVESLDEIKDDVWEDLLRDWFINHHIVPNEIMKKNNIRYCYSKHEYFNVDLMSDEEWEEEMADGNIFPYNDEVEPFNPLTMDRNPFSPAES